VRFLIRFLVLSFFSGSVFASVPISPFQFLQQPGPYSVGVKVVDQHDRTRPYPVAATDTSKPSAAENARPLQTLIWYPALPSAGKPMTVGDYVRLADTEIHFDAPDEKGNKWRSRLRASLDIPLWAIRNATPEKGHYPVLIYAPSDSSVSWENADLCEYLASHGYVVLASPSMGASTRDMTDDLKGIDAEARDLSFLITFARTLSGVDMSKIAVVSWSWGGIASLFAAARDPRIDALAEMDGSMRYYPGLVRKAGDVHPDRMKIPLLFFTQGNASLEGLARDDAPASDKTGPNVLNAWSGNLFTVDMVGMSHPEFCSMFQRRKTAESFAEDEVADYGRDDANTSYAWVARYTLNFLDVYLKHNSSAKAFLERSPAANGVPEHFMGIMFRRARQADAKPVAVP
jgi:dienelactone hydrolase